jgi:hypothetical protein
MNAELIGMQTTHGDWQSVADAAARIRSSCDSLSALVTDYTAAQEDKAVGALAESIQFLLARGGIEVCVAPGSADMSVAVGFSVAVARLFSEWCAAIRSDIRDVDNDGPDKAFRLSLAGNEVRLEADCENPVVTSAARCFRYAECGASPPLAGFSPAAILREMGAGCGAWQARGTAGICAGVPRS